MIRKFLKKLKAKRDKGTTEGVSVEVRTICAGENEERKQSLRSPSGVPSEKGPQAPGQPEYHLEVPIALLLDL
jgi:hypothetical protein